MLHQPVAAAGRRPAGPVRYARFNPPWTPWLSAGTRSCNPSRSNCEAAAEVLRQGPGGHGQRPRAVAGSKPARAGEAGHIGSCEAEGWSAGWPLPPSLHLHRGSRTGPILWAAITSFVLVVAGGQWLHLRVMLSKQITVPPAVVSVLGLLALLVLYAIWTATPPDLPVFQPG